MQSLRFQGARGLLWASRPALRRFVPPWEADGKTPDELFGDLFSSSNPLQRLRSQKRRREEATEVLEAAKAMEEAEQMQEREAQERFIQHQLALEQMERDFLPYGATPSKYFDKTNMAAWGIYQQALHPSSPASTLSRHNQEGSGSGAAVGDGMYSSETQALLASDMDCKLPYPAVTPVLDQKARGVCQWPYHGTVGVVLDIDGVVYRSRQVIEGSDEAIKQMQQRRIPFLFMTNGGGKTEAERAEELSAILGTRIEPDQVLMNHTPMQHLVERYRDETVLIVGSPNCAKVAESYGFRKAKSILEFQAEHPELVPLKHWPVIVKRHHVPPSLAAKLKLIDHEHADDTSPSLALVHPIAQPNAVPYPSIAAILQFNDVHDAFHDAQVMVDVLTAPDGRIGSAISRAQTIPFYFGADDLIFAANAPLPRFGGGAFREMLHAVYESITGSNLHVTHYGKPRAIAYNFAEARLRKLSERLGWRPDDMRMIAMVGDNLETDVLGANAAGAPWLSVHVLSGVGSAPAAKRTLSDGDEEMEWMEQFVDKTPHYVAPTLDHFLREMLNFPESAIIQNRRERHIPPCPADLQGAYNVHPPS